MQEQFSARALTGTFPKNEMLRGKSMPEMQEQFPAGAWTAQRPGTKVRRKCRSIFRRVPGWLNDLTRRYAENAGAIFGACVDGHVPEKRNVAR
ncbi:MAG TPA: hypothetical protein VLC97_20965, partial [Rhodanobacteraceae bacterium]|nr:hypothetical protein [Rhodanobacteraceae bacterium]